MPKRTNAFQNLVARIFQLRAEDKSVVVESATVSEAGTDTPAEIDILILKATHGVTLRIAVECRDHARKQTVTWIRELSEKRRSMEIDKVIAVSTSGFTKGAIQKAQKENIDLLTLEAAEEVDWSKALLHISMSSVAFELELISVTLVLDGEISPQGAVDDKVGVMDAQGSQIQTVRGMVDTVLANRPTNIIRAIQQVVQGKKMPDDLAHQTPFTRRLQLNEVAIVAGRRLLAIDLHYNLISSITPVDADRYVLRDTHATHAVLHDGPTQVSIVATQWQDLENTVAISVENVDAATGAGGRLTRKGRPPNKDWATRPRR